MAFVAEKEFFENLTIKDKTELYEEFMEEKFRKNPQFEDHVLLMEVSVKKKQTRCEILEDEEPVVQEELETSFVFFDESISSMDLLCTTNPVEGYEVKEERRDISLRRQTRNQGLEDFLEEMETSFVFFDETYSSMDLICATNSAEAFGIQVKRRNRGEVVEDMTEEREKCCTFFKETFSSVMDLLYTINPVEADEVEEARKETEYPVEEGIIETLNKRCSNQMYSSLSIEAYAPSKKRRRTSDVKLHSHLHFPNEQLENLFFTWLRQKTNEAEIVPETSKSNTNNHLETVVNNYRTTKTSSSATAEKSDSAFSSLKTESVANGNNISVQPPVNDIQTAQEIVDLQKESIGNPLERSLLGSDTPVPGISKANILKPPHNEISDYKQPPPGALRSIQAMFVRTNCGNDNEPQRYNSEIPVTGEVQQVQQHLFDSPECPNCTVRTNISNAIDASQLGNDVSQFWIKSGDLFISMEIDHINGEKLQRIYRKFCKKAAETREVHFGIDEFQFMISYRYDFFINFEHLPNDKETSQYWISSGDLEIPFQGKHMSTEKILRLFGFFKSNVEDTSVLRFGIDKLDFSQIPDFWSVPDCSDLENTSNYTECESSNNAVLPDTLPLNDEYENLKETEASQCDPMENNFQSSSVFYDNNRRALVKNDCDNYRFDEMENNCELCDNNQNGLVINECENHYCQSGENDCQLPCTSASNNQGGLIRNDCDLSCPSCGGSVCELCLPTSSQAGPMNQLRVCEENCNHNQQMNVDNQNYESNEQIAITYLNCETDQQTEAIEQNNNSNSEALTSPEPSTGYFYRQNLLLSLELEAANHNNESNEQAEGINPDYDTDQEAEAYNEYSNDDSDGQVLVTDANEEIRDHDYEEPMQIASNSSSSADIARDIALDSAQNIQEFLNCIVTDINNISEDNSVEQFKTFMCLLRQGASVCIGHMDTIFNALINKRVAEPVDNYG